MSTRNLRDELVSSLRELALDLGCAGLREYDALASTLDRLADRLERAEVTDEP